VRVYVISDAKRAAFRHRRIWHDSEWHCANGCPDWPCGPHRAAMGTLTRNAHALYTVADTETP
jgi:hypothetical protein